jgi:hypothetical protein
MSPFRAILGFALVLLALLAFANLALWHSAAWFPIGFYGGVLALAVLFEAGRYRARAVPGADWKATGERFFDPTTGAPTEVYYDRQSGARDYRSR